MSAFAKRALLGCVGLFALGVARAQYDGTGDAYAGTWTGIITQETPETTRFFDLDITFAPSPTADSAYAMNSHVADGEFHAFMVGEATLGPDGVLWVREREIVRSDSIPGMEWCVKHLTLASDWRDADEVHLRGEWGGETSFGPCQPGELDLVRGVIRP